MCCYLKIDGLTYRICIYGGPNHCARATTIDSDLKAKDEMRSNLH